MQKATERGIAARFLVWDALALADLHEQFDTVLDSGLFHVLDDERRARYVTSLAAVLAPRGRVLLACFSDRQPGDWGPRRIRQAELRDVFAHGWVIESIEPVLFHTNLEPPIAEAWFSADHQRGYLTSSAGPPHRWAAGTAGRRVRRVRRLAGRPASRPTCRRGRSAPSPDPAAPGPTGPHTTTGHPVPQRPERLSRCGAMCRLSL